MSGVGEGVDRGQQGRAAGEGLGVAGCLVAGVQVFGFGEQLGGGGVGGLRSDQQLAVAVDVAPDGVGGGVAGAEGRGGQVDPDQGVGSHVERGGEVADHGEAVNITTAALDLGQPRLGPSDKAGQRDLGQAAAAPVGGDPVTDADHIERLPQRARCGIGPDGHHNLTRAEAVLDAQSSTAW